jgi:hypothetical protein
MTAQKSMLKQFALSACYREACARVLNARMASLRIIFSQYGARPPGPVDLAVIDRAVEELQIEDNRRERILEALTTGHAA